MTDFFQTLRNEFNQKRFKSREVFLSVAPDGKQLLSQYSILDQLDPYYLNGFPCAARRDSSSKWISHKISKVTKTQDSEGNTTKQYQDFICDDPLLDSARISPLQGLVYKKSLLNGKSVPAFFLDLFTREAEAGGPPIDSPYTFVGLSDVDQMPEVLFARDLYIVGLGVDPLSALDEMAELGFTDPRVSSRSGLYTYQYNFGKQLEFQIIKEYSPLKNEQAFPNIRFHNELNAPQLSSYSDMFFIELGLERYFSEDSGFQKSSEYRPEFDFHKNREYFSALYLHALNKVSERSYNISPSDRASQNSMGSSLRKVSGNNFLEDLASQSGFSVSGNQGVRQFENNRSPEVPIEEEIPLSAYEDDAPAIKVISRFGTPMSTIEDLRKEGVTFTQAMAIAGIKNQKPKNLNIQSMVTSTPPAIRLSTAPVVNTMPKVNQQPSGVVSDQRSSANPNAEMLASGNTSLKPAAVMRSPTLKTAQKSISLPSVVDRNKAQGGQNFLESVRAASLIEGSNQHAHQEEENVPSTVSNDSFFADMQKQLGGKLIEVEALDGYEMKDATEQVKPGSSLKF